MATVTITGPVRFFASLASGDFECATLAEAEEWADEASGDVMVVFTP